MKESELKDLDKYIKKLFKRRLKYFKKRLIGYGIENNIDSSELLELVKEEMKQLDIEMKWEK